MRVLRSLLSLMLSAVLLLQALPTAQADAGFSVSVSYTCSAPEPVVGSTLTFSLTGVGTVDYCVMIVEPDSMQTFLYGASSTYVITKPGTHIIIAYGTNSTDPSAPGFARCMSGMVMIEAGEGEPEPVIPRPNPADYWTMEPRANSLYIYSARGVMFEDPEFNPTIVMAKGTPGKADRSTIRLVEGIDFWQVTLEPSIGFYADKCRYEATASYLDDLGMEPGKTYHFTLLDEGMTLDDVSDFILTYTYEDVPSIVRPADSSDIWNLYEDGCMIEWEPVEDAVRYEITITVSTTPRYGEPQTCELPLHHATFQDIRSEGLIVLYVSGDEFEEALPYKMQLEDVTITIGITAYAE